MLTQVRVLRREDITRDLLLLWIEKPEGFNFKPGQYCTIGLNGIERAYSISSAPHEDNIELFVELVSLPDGVLTPELWKLQVGDRITIRPRTKGLFVLKPALTNQLLIATVTGIVPYISFMRDCLYKGCQKNHFYVLQGASYCDEFTYKDELENLACKHPDRITYIPTVSRPSEERNIGWLGETGRVDEIVEKCVEEHGFAPENTLFYVCGHPGMIENVKSQFIPRGFKVEEERFWKEG